MIAFAGASFFEQKMRKEKGGILWRDCFLSLGGGDDTGRKIYVCFIETKKSLASGFVLL